MNTEIISKKASALNLMASKFSVEPDKLLNTLKATVFKGATNDELLALVVVANSYGLNPLLKEIYAFPAKGGGIVPVVSVDGWIRMCNDHPMMDGMEFFDEQDANGELVSVTCKIYRKDRRHPTVITEYLVECRRNTEPWKMANRMLRHKALIQCARVAFGFSGIQDEDEANDTVARVVTGRVVTETAARIENPYREPAPETFADLPAPEPSEEPLPESPLEVAEDTERTALVGEIKAALAGQGSTVAKFAPLCREAGLLTAGVQLGNANIDNLRYILANMGDILAGSYIALQ